jgi:YVTN family beta-propeller protein
MRLAVLAFAALAIPGAAQSWRNYESATTRSVAVSADGLRLYALNTPDNRLAVYTLADPARPVLLREIQVGLEPVALAERTPSEVWVVNAVSDSISVVDVARGIVIDTIRTGDEPGAVVFANGRAFVSVSTSREVRVFGAITRQQVGTVAIFGDEPRYLLASADGTSVWVAVQLSGNKTTIVPESLAPPPPPPTNPNLPAPPRTGLIVDSDDPAWKPILNVNLPDHDVVEIDPVSMTVRRVYSGVGAVLFGMAQRPGSAELWVANTHARNLVRFEPQLRGHSIDSRVTRIGIGGGPITPIDLNPGIDYATLPNDPAVAIALSQPTDIVWNAAGTRGFVAAFGTDRIGVIDAAGAVLARIEVGNATGAQADPRNKRGPRALALHPSAALLYVHNRLANGIAVIDTVAQAKIAEVGAIFDPTPAIARQGRGFLYDAKLSGNGTMACAACHIDARLDGVSWDLGDRGGVMGTASGRGGIGTFAMHPMKGPMVTQTLQGLRGLQPFHWRGDRARLQDFNPAFASLLGKQQLAAADMDDFVAFLETIEFPANPHQRLDRTYSTQPVGTSAQEGFVFFTSTPFNGALRCVDCHSISTGTNGLIIPGSVLQEPQDFKVPQLRNLYKRTGRKPQPLGRTAGFAMLHDGSIDSVFNLLSMPVFGTLSTNATNKTKLMNFVEAFDTGTAPAVGHQRTVTQANAGSQAVLDDLQLLEAQAAAGNCALIAKGELDGRRIGLRFDVGVQRYASDRAGLGPFTRADLLTAATQGRAVLTMLGVPPGSETRIGLDRDLDGTKDGDEGLEPYGASTPGCAGALMLSANSTPDLGNAQFALVCERATPSSNGVLLLGFAATSFPFLGIDILVDVAQGAALPMPADANGVGVRSLSIPARSSLQGANVFVQAVFPSACGPQGLAASQGLRFTIGL